MQLCGLLVIYAESDKSLIKEIRGKEHKWRTLHPKARFLEMPSLLKLFSKFSAISVNIPLAPLP